MSNTIQLFSLNLRAPKNCKQYLFKALRSPTGEPLVDVEAAQHLLLQKFPLQYSWQQTTYAIGQEAETLLSASPAYLSLLLPLRQDLAFYLVLEDAKHLLFRTDSSLHMLQDRLKRDGILRELYLFLLENSALPTFVKISKEHFYKLREIASTMLLPTISITVTKE